MLPIFGVFPKIGCNFATESSIVFINLKSLIDMKRNWIFGTLGIAVLLAPLPGSFRLPENNQSDH